MYLFVFIFLLLSVMGLFTQTFLIQAARIWENQKSAAQIMHTWHMSAYALAKESSAAPVGAATSCVIDLSGGAGKCTGTNSSTGASGVVYLSVPTNGQVWCPACTRYYLPPGYKAGAWTTLVYKSGTVTYLATYTNASKLGFMPEELYAQMKKAKIPYAAFGQVRNNVACAGGQVGRWFVTNAFFISGTTTKVEICYPADATIPTGSVGFVTIL